EVVAADQEAWRVGAGCPSAGRLLTLDRIVGDPAEKRLLERQYQARAVDMESAVIASACSRHGVPCVCVRAVSDDAHTGLSPRLVQLLSGAHVSWRRLLLAILRWPPLLVECVRLSKATRFAARRLATALHELIAG